MRRLVGWLAIGLLLLLVWPWAARPAAAHAVPVLSEPQPNAALAVAPPLLSIRFSEPVVPNLSQIAVLTQAGAALEVSALRVLDAEGRTLAVDLPPLPDGSYLVSWQVLSAVDGHTTTGTFSFGVGVAVAAADEEAVVTAELSPLSAAARWLTLTGLAGLLGFFTFRLLLLNPVLRGAELEPEEAQLDLAFARDSRRVAAGSVGLLAAGVLLIFINQAGAYRLLDGSNLQVWLGTRFGQVWAVRLGLVLLFGLLVGRVLAVRQRDGLRGVWWWLGLGGTAVLAITSALVSHSAALPQDAARGVAIDLAHVLAAGVWVGGLLQLALLAWRSRQLLAESRLWLNLSLVLNFSALAAGAVGVLLVSGGYLAWQHVGSWTALVGTAYGQMLLAKIGLALPAFAIAGINLWFVKPRLQRAYDTDDEVASEPGALRRFRRLVQVEAGVALLVLAAAGILTDLQRAADAPLLADAASSTVVEQAAEGVNVILTIEPALVGANRFDVYLEDPAGQPIADASEVALRYTFLGQSLGAAEGVAEPVGGGHYVVDGSYISLIGTWQVEVAIRQPGAFDTFAPFRLEAGLGGNIRPLDSGKRPLEELAGFMQIAGGGATGAFLVLFAIAWGAISVKATRRTWELLLLMGVSLFAFWLGGNQMFTYFTEEYTPAKFATNPILPDAASIAMGQSLFATHCAACHGDQGLGDGPAAEALPYPPANFSAGHTAIHSDGDLYYWILEGIEATPMPAFGDRLSAEEAWHLVNYVRRLSVVVDS